VPALRNGYLIDLGDGSPASAWDPRELDDPPRADCVFFGRAFLAMERLLDRGARTVVLTWDVERLPVTGPEVVAVVIGDEASRRPPYAESAGHVFKCYGARPRIGGELLRSPSPLSALIFLEDARRRVRALPDDRRLLFRAVAARLGRAAAPARVHEIPLGYYNQLDIPLKPFERRETSVFFAGSVATELSGRSGRRGRHLQPPRVVSRRQMLEAVSRFERRRPDLRTVVRVTPGFASATREGALAYSEALMDARVCLSPRGGSAETFRFFEALRYGCVVVGEALPRRWFYEGAPVVTVRRWHRLPAVLESLLDDPEGLRERHLASLAWWRERCSEEAVGAYMAERLNSARG
jgi:hypothetical protein